MKKLRARDYLLLGLAFVGDLIDETLGKGSYAYSYRTLNFWAPPGFKPLNLRQTVWRLLRTEEIEKVVKNGKPYLRLSNKGRKKLEREFSFLKWAQWRWDKTWRLVIFDISEKHRQWRDRLRHQLVNIGFGRLQKSIYISPYPLEEDIVEFLKSRKLFGHAYLLKAQHQFLGEAKELAARVWPLKKINSEYLKILKESKRVFKKFPSSQPKTIHRFQLLKERYLLNLANDPWLPKELLPSNWAEPQLRKFFLSLNLL